MATWGDGVLDRLRSPVLDAVSGLTGVWVVGGAVRDALLGREPKELDLLVEGDPAAVVRALGVPTATHDRFGTAIVAGADVAAARRETYAHPGALPDVTLGATVAEDLARRDLTVNALAVRVADGREEAWPGALEDLEAGRLRVLHRRSFEDDPTRLLRMARYAARLGFTIEDGTEALAAAAIRSGALATVSGARLGAEIRLALTEPLPAALLELDRSGLGPQVIHRDFDANAELIAAVLAATPPGAVPGLAALGACLLDAEGVASALDVLAIPAGERDIVTAAAAAGELAAALHGAGSPADVAGVVARQPAEALAVAAALGAAEPVARWLDEWRHVRLAITGDDLLEAGLRGPAIGTGLRAAHAAALNGEAGDRESQLAIAVGAAE